MKWSVWILSPPPVDVSPVWLLAIRHVNRLFTCHFTKCKSFVRAWSHCCPDSSWSTPRSILTRSCTVQNKSLDTLLVHTVSSEMLVGFRGKRHFIISRTGVGRGSNPRTAVFLQNSFCLVWFKNKKKLSQKAGTRPSCFWYQLFLILSLQRQNRKLSAAFFFCSKMK